MFVCLVSSKNAVDEGESSFELKFVTALQFVRQLWTIQYNATAFLENFTNF